MHKHPEQRLGSPLLTPCNGNIGREVGQYSAGRHLPIELLPRSRGRRRPLSRSEVTVPRLHQERSRACNLHRQPMIAAFAAFTRPEAQAIGNLRNGRQFLEAKSEIVAVVEEQAASTLGKVDQWSVRRLQRAQLRAPFEDRGSSGISITFSTRCGVLTGVPENRPFASRALIATLAASSLSMIRLWSYSRVSARNPEEASSSTRPPGIFASSSTAPRIVSSVPCEIVFA